MKRLRTIPFAVAVLAVSGGAALAFSTMPDASAPGLTKATEASGHTVPARPATPPGKPATVDESTDALVPDVTPDTPDAASHGAAVSAVAKGEDTTPDTNHGADVSAVAKDNHGQATAATHRSDHHGKPADTGKPEDPGQPGDPGKPDKP